MSSKEQFEQIYHAHVDLVLNLSLGYVRNQTIAEDLTQEVFVKVYHELERFESKSSIKTWVYRITVNHCLDYLKAQQRSKRKGFLVAIGVRKESGEVDPPSFDHPGVILENKEEVEGIFNCIDRLPENQKNAILLKSIEDLSQKEIAEVLNMTEKAVESLLSRARKKLKELLEQIEG